MTIQNLKEIMISEYGLNVQTISKSDESTDGNVYILEGLREKYVVKVYSDYAHAELMTKLHMNLYEHGLNLPYIIKRIDGEFLTITFDKKYIVCYSFAKGATLKQSSLTDDRIIAVARYLSKLHSISADGIDLESVPFSIDSKRQSILHFDVTKNNIFVDDEDDISFIDFDDSKFGPAVCDVAIGLTNLFISRAKGADIDGMKTFLDAYYFDNMALKLMEIPLIKTAALEWLSFTIKNENLGSSIIEGLENKIRIWNNLKLEEIDT